MAKPFNRNLKRFQPKLFGNKGGIPNPSDAGFYWTGEYDGTDLVNRNGTNVPLVSGSGLDAIYDFGVLGDARLDKGSYVGNAFALPENYDFPYPSEIYYNPATAATRKHWKLKDFHYRFIQTQMDIAPQLINNIYFADLNYTATVLQNISQLIIYNTEQIGSDLDILLRIIGILPDYLGVERILDGGFTNTANWTTTAPWTISGGFAIYDKTVNGNLYQADQVGQLNVGELIQICYDISNLSTGTTIMRLIGSNGGQIIDELLMSVNGSHDIEAVISNAPISLGTIGLRAFASSGSAFNVTNFSVKRKFNDYYKSEI